MKYFIRSPYWTRNYGTETWWKSDSCGYTSLMADAGVYTEADKRKMQKYHEVDRCEFIPITKDILETAMRQLDKEQDSLRASKVKLAEKYENQIIEIEDELGENLLKCRHLIVLADELSKKC